MRLKLEKNKNINPTVFSIDVKIVEIKSLYAKGKSISINFLIKYALSKVVIYRLHGTG